MHNRCTKISVSTQNVLRQAREPKRRGGRGFYADRDTAGRDKPKSLCRDRNRQPEARATAELVAAELAQLAGMFPTFRSAFNRLRSHVLIQARSEDWKCQAVLECLSSDPVTVEEIIEETDLEGQSIVQALSTLEARGQAVKCNHQGDPLRIRRDGKPASQIHWRKGPSLSSAHPQPSLAE